MKKLISLLGIVALICFWMAYDADVKEDIKTIIKGTVRESRNLMYTVKDGWDEGIRDTSEISDTTVVY